MLDAAIDISKARVGGRFRTARRILLIEPDLDLARALSRNFTLESFEVVCHSDVTCAFERFVAESWDVVVLAASPPEAAIFELCGRLRRAGLDSPIVVLGTVDSLAHRVLSLDAGADEYLAKPISTLELMARIRAILRRAERLEAQPPGRLRIGGIEIDAEAREIRVEGELKNLTVKEFELLRMLAARPDRAFSRAELLKEVWGYRHDGYEHTVNTHVNRLRAKIERDPAHPKRLVTVRGVGYKLRGQ